MIKALFTLSFFLYLLGCGSSGSQNLGGITYYLEFPGTHSGDLKLVFEGDNPSHFFIKLENPSAGLSFDQPTNLMIPIPHGGIKALATQGGDNTFDFTLYNADGGVLSKENIAFDYDKVIPDAPPLAFSEKATKDTQVQLLVSTFRDERYKEIFLEGDVDPEYAGRWLEINQADRVDFHVTRGEGLKTVNVKLRNTYNAITDFMPYSIYLDQTKPQNCHVELASNTVGSPQANLRISADDSLDLTYRVLGDTIEATSFKDITSGETAWVSLGKEEGVKNLQVYIGDAAQNFCDPITLEVTFDKSYEPIGLSLKNNPYYTNNQLVTIKPRIDTFDTSKVEMFIDGGVEGEGTHEWVPFAAQKEISLKEGTGNRFIYIKYRDQGGETVKVHTQIYLQPFARYHAASASLALSRMVGVQSVTIKGCSESYEAIEPESSSLACQPKEDSGSVIWSFADGSQLDIPFSF